MTTPRRLILMNLLCCTTVPIPEGITWLSLSNWPAKLCLLCRCIICHAIIWFVWFMIFLLLAFLPQEPKFTVTDASLTQFNLSNTTNNPGTATLHYNLTLDITIRNPNRRAVGLYYHRVIVAASYRNKKFGFVTLVDLVPFYQGHKNTTSFQHVVLQGQQQLVKFGQRDISEFDKEAAARVFSIKTQVSFRVEVSYGKLKAKFLTVGSYGVKRTDCNLKVPLSGTNNQMFAASSFKATKCEDVDIFSG